MADELGPLHIGPVTVDFPVVLAALAGFSEPSYRLHTVEVLTKQQSNKFVLKQIFNGVTVAEASGSATVHFNRTQQDSHM